MIQYLKLPDFENAHERGWDGPGWYFWSPDDDGANVYGPYLSEAIAKKKFAEYVKQF